MQNLEQLVGDLSPAQRELFLLRLNRLNKTRNDEARFEVRPQPRTSGFYPLSLAQERLWFLDQLNPGNPAYNMFGSALFKGAINVAALTRSFNEMVRRHEILRTTFKTVNGRPVQVIAPTLDLQVPVIDLREHVEAEREAVASLYAHEQAQQPFDLSRGPLLRLTLLRWEEEEHQGLLAMHHIISDGWSRGIIVRETAKLYAAFSAGRPALLEKLPVQYVDFAICQRQWLEGEVLRRQLDYWTRQLGTTLPVMKLFPNRLRPSLQTFVGACQRVKISGPLTAALKEISRREGASLFMLLLAAFKTLLARYSGLEDIIVGTGIANRNHPELEGLIGFFVNTLVLRTDLSGDPTFRELLARVKKVTLEAYAHQDLPFGRLVEELQPERDLRRPPLAQVAFTFQNAPLPDAEFPGLTFTLQEFNSNTSKFDIELIMEETGEGLGGRLEYNAQLFDAATVAQLTSRFNWLLGSIAAQPDAPLSRLEIFGEEEQREQILEEKERQESSRSKLRSARRKAVNLAQNQLVDFSELQTEQALPLVVRPRIEDVNLAAWLESNRELVEARLLEHGAILCRGFRVNLAEEFARVAVAVSPQLEQYNEASTPRTEVSAKVYTSTEYPSDQTIPLHNEHSYSRTWPMKLWFYCWQPSISGGETPLADSRKVLELLDPELVSRFARRGVMYVRNYRTGLDLPWQKVFQTTSRREVEDYCRRAGIEFEWKAGDFLRTRQVCQAVAEHPRTAERVWFNQAHLFHVSNLDPVVSNSLLAEFSSEELPRNACYGDGSPIESSAMDEIRRAYRQVEVRFPWQRRDVLLVDNMLVAHGRMPFEGARSILVAMAELFAGGKVQGDK